MTALECWRKSLGWSQARASKELGCAIRSIRNWEDGTYDAPKYILLAAAWIWTRERPFDRVPFDLSGKDNCGDV